MYTKVWKIEIASKAYFLSAFFNIGTWVSVSLSSVFFFIIHFSGNIE